LRLNDNVGVIVKRTCFSFKWATWIFWVRTSIPAFVLGVWRVLDLREENRNKVHIDWTIHLQQLRSLFIRRTQQLILFKKL